MHVWLALTRLPAGRAVAALLSLVAAVGAVGASPVAGRPPGRAGDRRWWPAWSRPPTRFVVQYAAEARGYGLALLAVSASALGLARWLDGSPALVLWTVAALGAGLAHWFALLVVAGLALAALVLRRRAALPLVALTALAALPALALVAVATVQDDGGSTHRLDRRRRRGGARLSLQAWTSKAPGLLVAVLVSCALAVALRRRDRVVVVGACWLLVPVLL